jgi:hypothetical protein
MPALDAETLERWRGLVVVDRDAATIGSITAFFHDRVSGMATWGLVHTGWWGDARTYLPLRDAVEVGGEIRVPYTKAQVRDAPELPPGAELTADDELVLVGHYGLNDLHGAVMEAGARLDPEPDRGLSPGWFDHLTSDAPTAPAPAAPVQVPPGQGVTVTRSEEELRVGIRTRLRRLRLRKYIVTEYVTRTFPVRREEVRLEESTGEAAGGADPDAPLPELVLHTEEPVVTMRVVPVERVRLVKSVVRDERTLREQLRREQVQAEVETDR